MKKSIEKIPKIKNIYFTYSKTDDVFDFTLGQSVMKSNGEIDKKLILDLKKNNCLERLKENLKSNYKNNKIRKYNILLDNGNWIRGKVIGKNK